MSKAKKKKTQPDSKTHKPTAKDKRKKFWIKQNLKKRQKATTPLKPQGTAETPQPATVKDGQQFSSNWKALQEVCLYGYISVFLHILRCLLHFNVVVKLPTAPEGHSAGEKEPCDTQTERCLLKKDN